MAKKASNAEEIIRLHKIGADNSEIARWLNVAEDYVEYILKLHGIDGNKEEA